MTRLVLKTELNSDELFAAIRAATFAKHRKSKTLQRLLKKGETKIVTRVELKLDGELRLGNLTAVVDISEMD